MDARDFIKIGMSAERLLTVTLDLTVGHFVPGMPAVYAHADDDPRNGNDVERCDLAASCRKAG